MTILLRTCLCLTAIISFVPDSKARELTPGEIVGRMMTDTVNTPHERTIREDSIDRSYQRDRDRELEEERRKTEILMRERREQEDAAFKQRLEEQRADFEAAREKRNADWAARQEEYKPADIQSSSYTEWDDEDEDATPHSKGKKLSELLEDLE